jgi:hypothetical protein
VAKWKNYTGELVQRIIDDVTGTEAYKTFAADNLSRFDIKDPAPERCALNPSQCQSASFASRTTHTA